MTPRETLINLFNLSPELSALLLESGEVRTIQAGEVLEVQGQEIENFLFVLSGLISVYRQNYDGAERFAGFIPPGYMYGESAILHSTKLYGRYHIQETMTALVIPASTALELYETNLELSKITAKHVSMKLLYTSRMLFISHERNSNRKVGLALDGLYRVTKKRSLPLSVEDIAGLLGMSRNTVSKTLDYWEEQGAITNAKAKITFNSSEPFSSITDGMVF